MPALFIQPCHTAEVMREVGNGSPIKLEDYLMIWVGFMGRSVGLTVRTAHDKSEPETCKDVTIFLE